MKQKQRQRLSRQHIVMLAICAVLLLPFVLHGLGFMPHWSERTNTALSVVLVAGLLGLGLWDMRRKAKLRAGQTRRHKRC